MCGLCHFLLATGQSDKRWPLCRLPADVNRAMYMAKRIAGELTERERERGRGRGSGGPHFAPVHCRLFLSALYIENLVYVTSKQFKVISFSCG